MKRMILLSLAALFAFSGTVFAYPSIELDGEKIETDTAPMIDGGRTLVPARAVFEALGGDVGFENGRTTVLLGGHEIIIKTGSDIMTADGAEIKLDVPAMISNGRTLIPLRAVAESAGIDVSWDEKTETVKLVHAESFADMLDSRIEDDKNYMFSPLSVKTAMAMAANGAEGQTKKEILDTLGIENLDEYNNRMKSTIEAYKNGENVTVNIANSIWLNKDNIETDFLDSYKKTIMDFYDGEAAEVDSSNAVDKINSWTNDKTNGKIAQIISDPNFSTSLVNAVYFKGNWRDEFMPSGKMTFHSKDGTEKDIDFMQKTKYMHYAEQGGVRAVEIPYKSGANNSFSMYLMMSDDDFATEATLNSMQFERKKVILKMPKFRISYTRFLKDDLKAMGIKTAFDGDTADFSKMNSLPQYIDEVLHKTYIDVDEKGTEAAAVTAVLLAGASANPVQEEPIEFTADRPFTFVIKDNTSGEILFMGKFSYAN